MRHPFELKISELENINFELEELNEKTAENVTGGTGTFSVDFVGLTADNSNVAGGGATTMATHEEGGDNFTSMATHEEGGDG